MKPDADNVKKIRIGAVSYLNTKPLVYGLPHSSEDWEILFDLPSRLADNLRRGELDVALIPSIEVLRCPEYRIVSDACIACRGPVLSVKLLSRVPMGQIRSLALDEGSRTSAALVQILLHDRFGVTPAIETLAIGQGFADVDTDAVLLIGDRAIPMGPSTADYQWDLGAEWCASTGLPFVFAMWTARPGVPLHAVGDLLAKARDAGVGQLRAIAQTEARRIGLDQPACYDYLRKNLYFYLGVQEQRGLQLFFKRARELAFLPPHLTWNAPFS